MYLETCPTWLERYHTTNNPVENESEQDRRKRTQVNECAKIHLHYEAAERGLPNPFATRHNFYQTPEGQQEMRARLLEPVPPELVELHRISKIGKIEKVFRMIIAKILCVLARILPIASEWDKKFTDAVESAHDEIERLSQERIREIREHNEARNREYELECKQKIEEFLNGRCL